MARIAGLCSVGKCGRVEVLRRGWCFKHYQRWRNYGDPVAPGVQDRTSQVAEAEPNAECQQCGMLFMSQHSDKGMRTRFCSWTCRNLGCTILSDAEREERRKRKNEISGRRRRARIAEVEREPYMLSDIAARDGFMCWLCNEPVDMSLKWPHPRSASVDHVIPLSRPGSSDTPQNVKLAHLGENVARGNRMDWRPRVTY